VQEEILAQSVIGVEIEKWQRKRCIRQFVLIVERNAKFRSSLTQADPYTAENAGLKEEIQDEDSRLS
jgi:hypothetical protein